MSLPCARSFEVPQAPALVSGVGLARSCPPWLGRAGVCRAGLGGGLPFLTSCSPQTQSVPSESQRRPSTTLCCADWSPLEPAVGLGSRLGFSSLGCARWVRREEAVT